MQDIKMSKTKLPKNWKWSKIGDIVEMQSGMAFKKAEYSTAGVRLFQIANVSFNYTKWDDLEHLPIEYIESHNHLLLKKGDIVLALNRPMLNNKLKIAELKQSDVPSILYQRVGRFIFKDSINKRYFLYYFQSPIFLKWLGEQLQGVNIPFINKSKLFSFNQFPLPPVETQQAIVSKIEELFSELDKGIEDLKTAQQQLKTYRQSVLKWAFEGKLTVRTGRDLSVQEGELPKGWEWKTFNDVCVKIGDIDHKMPKKTEDGKYPYLSTKDITNDLKLSFDNVKLISEEDYLLLSRKIKPEKGDIIFPRYGTIGKNVLVDTDNEFLISYSCAIVKPNPSLVVTKFIYLFSLSPKVTDEIRKYVVETTQANIGIASIKSFVFPLPPIEEQHLIVQEIESRLSVADKMAESIVQSLQQAEALRQSILKKAFSGELV